MFAPWIKKAGALCSEITPAVIASLYSVENGFKYGPDTDISPEGGRGPGRFTTAAWTAYGKDGDGDGKMDILGVADPVMTTGYRLCDLVKQAQSWQKSGEVEGDTVDLALAAYDVGPDAVREAGGVPADKSGEVPAEQAVAAPFVAQIKSLQDSFALMLAPFDYNNLAAAVGGVVEAGLKFLGLPYVWGGGNINGPSMGGFDCSGLTSYAIHAATGVTLPRTSETQWGVGVEIPLDQAQPGDLLFGNWQAGGPGHVAIYVGNGQMLHAPTFGDVVKVGPIFAGMKLAAWCEWAGNSERRQSKKRHPTESGGASFQSWYSRSAVVRLRAQQRDLHGAAVGQVVLTRVADLGFEQRAAQR